MYQVIIIEDDPMVAAIDKQYVEADSQFRVVRTFKSGGEALAHLPELKADLIILDYYTPGMNGTEFVDQLHTLGESPFIIAVTSRIRRFFDENPEHFFTSEQIAEHVGLSRITVRRYVNYMVDQGEITSSIDYQTGGRPSIRYLRLHS